MFKKHNLLSIGGYTDADWARDNIDKKCTFGYFTFVGGNSVTRRSKKQKVVALSSVEAEFNSMVKGLGKLRWLKRLLEKIGYPSKSTINLYCDNRGRNGQ